MAIFHGSVTLPVPKEYTTSWWFQPLWTNTSQNGNLPQIKVKFKKYLKPPPRIIWGFPKMVGFPNKPTGFPTKNDQHLGCEMGVPPFKETPISCHMSLPTGRRWIDVNVPTHEFFGPAVLPSKSSTRRSQPHVVGGTKYKKKHGLVHKTPTCPQQKTKKQHPYFCTEKNNFIFFGLFKIIVDIP